MKSASDRLHSFLLIEVSQQLLAVELAVLDGVQMYQAATPLPFTPDYFEGLVNIAGNPLAQINTAKYLQLSVNNAQNSLLMKHKTSCFLLTADSVLGTVDIADNDLYQCQESAYYAYFLHHENKVYCLDTATLLEQLNICAKPPEPKQGGYAELTLNHQKRHKLIDYGLFRIGTNYCAIPLVDTGRFVELQQSRVVTGDASSKTFAYSIIGKENYLLYSQCRSQAVAEQGVSLAFLLKHKEYNVALLADELHGVEQFSSAELQHCINKGRMLTWQAKVYQVFDSQVFWQELEQDYRSLLPVKSPQPVKTAIQQQQFLLFTIADAHYAVAFEHINRIEPWQALTAVHNHSNVKGVIAVDGRPVPVIAVFHAIDTNEYLILNDGQQASFAMAISSVLGSATINVDDVQAISSDNNLVTGLLSFQQTLYTVLNPRNYSIGEYE